ncbi:unnamed protein product [Staurois parvus]|uniref:Uncharacterized protein n=1 Tax=Staurois parvus TaxID=386267 RepID=A0ABN9G4B7_9NEOB|nr:unnamed protein product [Staurois parvus]
MSVTRSQPAILGQDSVIMGTADGRNLCVSNTGLSPVSMDKLLYISLHSREIQSSMSPL